MSRGVGAVQAVKVRRASHQPIPRLLGSRLWVSGRVGRFSAAAHARRRRCLNKSRTSHLVDLPSRIFPRSRTKACRDHRRAYRYVQTRRRLIHFYTHVPVVLRCITAKHSHELSAHCLVYSVDSKAFRMSALVECYIQELRCLLPPAVLT